jgi:DNA-binding transcriptional ArsR family regulator
MASKDSRKPADLESVLRALAVPRRVAILKLIHEVELPAGEIAGNFRTSRQAVSQHLQILMKLGLLDERRDGAKRLYTVRKEGFAELRAFLDVFRDDRLSSLKRQVEADKGKQRDQK